MKQTYWSVSTRNVNGNHYLWMFVSHTSLDCGEKSREIFASAIAESETILWNGPPGCFEKPQFEAGSLAMLKAVCDNKKAVKVPYGGETASLVIKYKSECDYELVSTGSGASLELLEGKTLPGVAALFILNEFRILSNSNLPQYLCK
ncbi:MAG: phosphoglycerate kinase [Marteilia pararefringens]